MPKEKTLSSNSSKIANRPSAGPDGASIAPPAYGIESVDHIPLENAPEPGTSVQMKAAENRTGLPRRLQAAGIAHGPHEAARLPDALKTGIEALSGMSLDDVRVHANSPRPAQLQALAYAQGTDIHVAPGQEQHLPHEAWHVVQQKQGRVRPTIQMENDSHIDNADIKSEPVIQLGRGKNKGKKDNNQATGGAGASVSAGPAKAVSAPLKKDDDTNEEGRGGGGIGPSLPDKAATKKDARRKAEGGGGGGGGGGRGSDDTEDVGAGGSEPSAASAAPDTSRADATSAVVSSSPPAKDINRTGGGGGRHHKRRQSARDRDQKKAEEAAAEAEAKRVAETTRAAKAKRDAEAYAKIVADAKKDADAKKAAAAADPAAAAAATAAAAAAAAKKQKETDTLQKFINAEDRQATYTHELEKAARAALVGKKPDHALAYAKLKKAIEKRDEDDAKHKKGVKELKRAARDGRQDHIQEYHDAKRDHENHVVWTNHIKKVLRIISPYGS